MIVSAFTMAAAKWSSTLEVSCSTHTILPTKYPYKHDDYKSH